MERTDRRRILEHLEVELAASRSELDPWPRLERAHVLSQPLAWPHTKVHVVMLRQAIHDRDRRETVGQLVRVLLAGPATLLGRSPAGNTGRSAMALTATASVPADLEAVLRSSARVRT